MKPAMQKCLSNERGRRLVGRGCGFSVLVGLYVCLHVGHTHVNNIRYFFESVHTFSYLELINYQPLLSAVNF